MNEQAAKEMLIGPHASIAGDLANAFAHGEKVGASCIQIFTRNQRTWNVKPLADEEITRFREAWAASPVREVMSHDSYLINLGSPEADKLEKSRKAFAEEAERCSRLGIRLLNFHPGAHMGRERMECLERIAEGVRQVMEVNPDDGVMYTVENTAGQGTTVGNTLEDLAVLLELLDDEARTGVCLDTCHLFAAGYDLVSDAGWEAFWQEFEGRVGLRYLKAFHLNDAKKPLGSRVDRHENLGEGCMGMDVFQRIAQDPRFHEIPMFLETPGLDPVWEQEIKRLREFRGLGSV